MSEKPLLIGQLPKSSGIKPDTVRFYAGNERWQECRLI